MKAATTKDTIRASVVAASDFVGTLVLALEELVITEGERVEAWGVEAVGIFEGRAGGTDGASGLGGDEVESTIGAPVGRTVGDSVICAKPIGTPQAVSLS